MSLYWINVNSILLTSLNTFSRLQAQPKELIYQVDMYILFDVDLLKEYYLNLFNKIKLREKMNSRLQKIQEISEQNFPILLDPFYLTLNIQRYKDIKVSRTIFLEFHQFMLSISDSKIEHLYKSIKHFTKYERVSQDVLVRCDYHLILQSVLFQRAIRNLADCDKSTYHKITRNYKMHQDVVKDYPKITSKHLIRIIKKLCNE